MPFTENPIDGCKVYFEDDGGEGTPIVILNGLGDPVGASRRWGVAQSLAEKNRLIFIDHRGHGRSGKPHDVLAYATPTRVADVISVLDELDVRQAHFIGLSWGARLLFGVGEHAPTRVVSLTMGGQTPYAINPSSSGVAIVTRAFVEGRSMQDFVDALGGFGGMDEETRKWTLDNDFKALAAAWSAAMAEGDLAPSMASWNFPCLIYAGSEDVDFYEDARRAASTIPQCKFVSLTGLTHLAAHENVDGILPHIQQMVASSGGI
jgi:pimeloyl-ACP methyl ester carboxylesterase